MIGHSLFDIGTSRTEPRVEVLSRLVDLSHAHAVALRTNINKNAHGFGKLRLLMPKCVADEEWCCKKY